jgi:hypothetical protein
MIESQYIALTWRKWKELTRFPDIVDIADPRVKRHCSTLKMEVKVKEFRVTQVNLTHSTRISHYRRTFRLTLAKYTAIIFYWIRNVIPQNLLFYWKDQWYCSNEEFRTKRKKNLLCLMFQTLLTHNKWQYQGLALWTLKESLHKIPSFF